VLQFEVGGGTAGPSVGEAKDNNELTPEEYAKKMFRELLAINAIDGPEANVIKALLGEATAADGIIDVEGEEIEDAEIVEIPSITTGRERGDEAPEWVDDDDYEPQPGDWVPDDLPELGDTQ
jgi:hypothetical protein